MIAIRLVSGSRLKIDDMISIGSLSIGGVGRLCAELTTLFLELSSVIALSNSSSFCSITAPHRQAGIVVAVQSGMLKGAIQICVRKQLDYMRDKFGEDCWVIELFPRAE